MSPLPQSSDDLAYAGSGKACRLMLPDPNDLPAGIDQGRVGLSVALDIALQLRSPILGIRLRPHAVFLAAVPKAAVDENG